MSDSANICSMTSNLDSGPLFTCLSCNKVVSDIEKHLNDEHNIRDFDVVEDSKISEMTDMNFTDVKVEKDGAVHEIIDCSSFNEMQYITEVDYDLLESGDNILFACHFCPISFDKFLNLKDHSIVSHNYIIHRRDCRHCKIMFNSHQKFIEHMKEKHPALKKHYKSVPCMSTRKVKLETDVGDSSSDEASNQLLNKKVKVLYCEECGKSFSTKYSLNNHLQNIHKRQIQDSASDVNVEKLFDFDQKLIGSKQITFTCTDCNINFSQLRDLKQHKNEFHSNRTYVCFDCDTIFESRGNLNLHNIYHHRIHRCSTCSIGFPGRLALTNHVKQHHPGMPIYRADSRFVCEYCSQSFSIRSQLSDHIQSVHLGLVNQCEDCGKVLSTSETLKVHRLKHRPEMHRTCEHCGRQFYRTGMLTEHIRACHPEALPEDWRRHTTCPYCQSRFTRRESLRRHIEAKHEPKILTCSFCDRQFTCRRYLVRHENKHHLGRPAC